MVVAVGESRSFVSSLVTAVATCSAKVDTEEVAATLFFASDTVGVVNAIAAVVAVSTAGNEAVAGRLRLKVADDKTDEPKNKDDSVIGVVIGLLVRVEFRCSGLSKNKVEMISCSSPASVWPDVLAGSVSSTVFPSLQNKQKTH